ncbi:MAG: uridine diphosphate-N-acetylglucosamine-binding protein YvcK [Candidatus Omnitrophota bacterium]|nr:uridine diphosphate-N-acetylglucosamine-binding protein YvcK [Candidatus Omnitrophota bacterium]
MKILLATQDASLATLIRRSLERFQYDWIQVDNGVDAFQTAMSLRVNLLILDEALPRMGAVEIVHRVNSIEGFSSPHVIAIARTNAGRERLEKENLQLTEVMSFPFSLRTLVEKVQQVLELSSSVVCFGGGTGLFTLLSGLKTLSGLSLTAIVSMSDDGGSTGKLRALFGILPPGDVRRSLIALSSAPYLLNELLQHRFRGGGEFKDHNVGNLLLTALTEMRGSMTEAVKMLGAILSIQGRVIPVTESLNILKAELENGAIIEGEHRIDLFEGNDPKLRIERLWQDPPAKANSEALDAIRHARFIVLGPGDLYTSVISNLIVEGVAPEIRRSKAKKIYICNVMTKPGETTDYTVSDHIREVVKYLGKDCLDYVFCSSTQLSRDLLELYAQKGQAPVIERNLDEFRKITQAVVIPADLSMRAELARHDSLKLATELKKIFDLQ